MRQKRSEILTGGIFYILSAVTHIFLAIIIGCTIDSVLIPEIEAEFDELIAIGELTQEGAVELLNFYYLVAQVIVIFLAIIAIVDIVMGILLIKHSKASDDIVANKKALLITSLVLAFMFSGIVTVIMLILALCAKVETPVVESTMVSGTVTNAETAGEETKDVQSDEINKKYESKIKKLQALRDSGAISQDEYAILLKQIFKD